MTIVIELVNDNMPVLLLNGSGSVNYTTQFFEGQNFTGFGGTVPVRLSSDLLILDEDAGPNVLTQVTISLVGGELYQYNRHTYPQSLF